jgi:ELWxxDGT repeat protein
MKTLILQLTAIFLMLLSMQPFMAQTPVLVKDINPLGDAKPENFIEFNGKMYFRANDGVHGIELWVSDGTAEGTKMLKDINPDGNSMPRYFTEYNGLLYFRAECSTYGVELWVTDGTEDGTRLLKDINPGAGNNSKPENQYLTNESWPLTVFDGKLYFAANNGSKGLELWVTDGTETGTNMVKDIHSGSYSSYPKYLTELNGKLYFSANNGTNGIQLWVSDGTEVNTTLLKDIYPGQYSSDPAYLTKYNGKIFFRAYYKPYSNLAEFNDLFWTDGTEAGTTLFKTLNGGVSSNPQKFIVYNNRLYFIASDFSKGLELWFSDGTVENTRVFKDISPGKSWTPPFNLAISSGKLFFAGNDGVNNYEPWVSDGTEDGTRMIKVLNNGKGSLPTSFTEFNGLTWFVALEDYYYRLFVTDGTESGTRAINLPETDDDYYGFDPQRTQLFVYNGELYFSAGYDEKGEELYKIDSSITSINDLTTSVSQTMSVYPNPAATHFSVDYPENINKLEIISMCGSTIMTITNPGKGEIPVSGIGAGAYIIVAYTANQILTQKLVIRR